MTTYARTDTTGLLWTNTAAWSPSTGYPSSAADAAQFTSALTAARGVTAVTSTIGQIEIVAPTGTQVITASASQIITINPTASYGGVGIKFTGSTGGTLTSSAALALGADQTWSFGTSGKVLTVSSTSNVLQGAYSLTLDGVGQFASSQANTFGGSGKTFKLQNGMASVPGAAGALGSALNTIDVGTDSYLDAGTIVLNQTVYRATGVGTYSVSASPYKRYTAILLGAFASKSLEFYGTQSSVSLNNATASGTFTGTVTGGANTIEINVTGVTTGLTNTANSFVAAGSGGSPGIIIGSRNISTLASLNVGYNVGATDAGAGTTSTNETAPFGDPSNAVRVLPSGLIYSLPTTGTTRTVRRNITFDGDPANTAIRNASTSATTYLAFAGDLTFSDVGGDVEVTTGTTAAQSSAWVSFRGTISGSGGLRLTNLANAGTSVEFNSTVPNAFASWTGSIIGTSGTYFPVVSYVAGYDSMSGVAFSGPGGIYINNGKNGDITLSHSSYSVVVTNALNDFFFTASFPNTTINLGPGGVTLDLSDVLCLTANTTLVFPGPISGRMVFGTSPASSTATYVLSGSNTPGGKTCAWNGGNLYLNNDAAFGSSTETVTFASTGTLDNTSGSSKTLSNTGTKALNANLRWAGSSDLSLGSGNTTWNGARTFTFAGGSATGTLTVPANTATTTASSTWNVGGGTSGAKQRLALNGGNVSTATAGSVTAGYFRINNNLGLGAVGTTATWTVSSGAALELTGSITPTSNKTAAILGTGPQIDGALRSVSGSNTWSGPLSISSAAVTTRFQVDAGTFTLSGAQIAPAVSGTPLAFTALGASAVLQQQRQLGANVGAVSTNNGGAGTVIFSTANLHSGALTCEAGGTTKVTNVNATGSGAGNDVFVAASATLESTVQSIFSAKLSLGTNGSGARAVLKFAA